MAMIPICLWDRQKSLGVLWHAMRWPSPRNAQRGSPIARVLEDLIAGIPIFNFPMG